MHFPYPLILAIIAVATIASATARAENTLPIHNRTVVAFPETIDQLARRYLALAEGSNAHFALFGKTRDELRARFSTDPTILSAGEWNPKGTEYAIPLATPAGTHYDIYKFTFDKDGRVKSIKRSKSGRDGFSESLYVSKQQVVKEDLKRSTGVIKLSENSSAPISKEFTQAEKQTVLVYAHAKRGVYHLLLGDNAAGLNDIAESERLRIQFGLGPIDQLNF